MRCFFETAKYLLKAFCATVEKNGKRHVYCRVFILEISSISYSPHFSISLLILLFAPKLWALGEVLNFIL